MGLFRKKKEPLICVVCGKEAGTLPWNAADGKFCIDCYNKLKKYGYTADDWFDAPSARIRHWIEMSESVHEYDRPGEEYSAEEQQKIMEELASDAEEFLRWREQRR